MSNIRHWQYNRENVTTAIVASVKYAQYQLIILNTKTISINVNIFFRDEKHLAFGNETSSKGQTRKQRREN